MKNLTSYKGCYYLRVRVPVRLQKYIGYKFLRKSLGTKDIKLAKIACKALTAKIEELFTFTRIMNDTQIKEMVKEFVKNYLYRTEAYRSQYGEIPPDVVKHLADFKGYFADKIKGYLATNQVGNIRGFVDMYLEEKEINLDSDSPEYKKLTREFAKALIEIYKIEKERVLGNYNNEYDNFFKELIKREEKEEDPLVVIIPPELSTRLIGGPVKIEPAPDKVAPSGKLLNEVIEEFKAEKNASKSWNEKNAYELNLFYANLPEIIGNKPVKDYTKSDFTNYSNLLHKFPKNVTKMPEYRGKTMTEIVKMIKDSNIGDKETISTKTINKYLVQVNMLFDFAKRQGYININFCEGLSVKDRRKDNEQRETYDEKDLEALFNSPVYKVRETIDTYPERWWIPLIALFSGMRLSEIAQLHKEDIVDIDEIKCFDINNKGDKSVKTKDSSRIVPIPPVILELGFIKYIETVDHKQVFKNLKKGRDGYGHTFTKWFDKYNRLHVTTNKKRVFHSFRHTFIDNLKQQQVDKNVMAEIVGHSNNSITLGRYGKDYNVRIKYETIEKVRYNVVLPESPFVGP